jgi:hypothetical protein
MKRFMEVVIVLGFCAVIFGALAATARVALDIFTGCLGAC